MLKAQFSKSINDSKLWWSINLYNYTSVIYHWKAKAFVFFNQQLLSASLKDFFQKLVKHYSYLHIVNYSYLHFLTYSSQHFLHSMSQILCVLLTVSGLLPNYLGSNFSIKVTNKRTELYFFRPNGNISEDVNWIDISKLFMLSWTPATMRYCYEWLPRWKFPAFIDHGLQRINIFS